MRDVRIISDGDGGGTKVYDNESGQPLNHIAGIRWSIAAGDVARAEVDMIGVAFDGLAGATFMLIDPRDGKLREVRSVTFTSGETVDF